MSSLAAADCEAPLAAAVADCRARLRIAIVVQGRFHAFDLAQALIARGHFVRVLTNYPKWVTRRFGLADQNVITNRLQGLAGKIFNRLKGVLPFDANPALHRWFGSWAARKLDSGEYDVIHGFTQVAEEPLQTMNAPIHTLVRGSAHIRTQAEILHQEQERVGRKLEQPSPWSIAREEREYQLADTIFVLSTFALSSFLEQGISANRVRLLPLGVDTRRFRPCSRVVSERVKRITEGEPLRVLTVGTFSCRKGALDYAAITDELSSADFRFRFVGAIEREAAGIARKLARRVEFVGRQKHSSLPEQYAWADVFVFPTLEDGFAVVLAQAQAACLPILTTTNSSGPDLITEGRNGSVLPIRDSKAFVSRLRWCAENRCQLAAMVTFLEQNHRMRDWADVAVDFENTMYELLSARARQVPA